MPIQTAIIFNGLKFTGDAEQFIEEGADRNRLAARQFAHKTITDAAAIHKATAGISVTRDGRRLTFTGLPTEKGDLPRLTVYLEYTANDESAINADKGATVDGVIIPLMLAALKHAGVTVEKTRLAVDSDGRVVLTIIPG